MKNNYFNCFNASKNNQFDCFFFTNTKRYDCKKFKSEDSGIVPAYGDDAGRISRENGCRVLPGFYHTKMIVPDSK